MRSSLHVVLFILTFSTYISDNSDVNALEILGIFPYQGKSHFFVFEKYLSELANRGHNVTVISHFPKKQPPKNYKDISLAGSLEILTEIVPMQTSLFMLMKTVQVLLSFGSENCKVLLQNNNVQQLWKSKTIFDVVVLEQFQSDCALGVAHELRAPVVGLTSHVPMPWHHARFGIPTNPAYTTSHFLGVSTSLYERISTNIIETVIKLAYKIFSQGGDQKLLGEHFDDVPPLEELAKQIKVLLLYQSYALTGSNLFPANVIEVGGYHVEKPKALPDDLKKFMDESTHGVIYISFGSMLDPTTAPKGKLEEIIKALIQLPQRKIFKWDPKRFPQNLKDFYVSNWLPQNDILAHPNVKAFYSHCGLLGTTEAIHHGVPIVGMPIFGDQPANADAIQRSGLGVKIYLNALTTESLLSKFRIVLDPKFRKHVKELSKVWLDRPMSPIDSAIFWTEFAARNYNFTFKTAAVDVPFYQYYCFDLLLIYTLFISGFLYLFKKIFIRRKPNSQKAKQPQTKADKVKNNKKKPKRE